MCHLPCPRSGFDALVEGLGLWKLETVGDAYIVAAGLFDDSDADKAAFLSSNAVSMIAPADIVAAAVRATTVLGHTRAVRKPDHVRANIDAVLSLALSMQVRRQQQCTAE